ncbi:SDR family NAD(P)-dependent oxidoreductase [Bernardetia sp.]|uniref:SDR family NAD(P)-dependent oxidoreductase n=1 Tax=Bernardetia sp. TaxID=1937974 RepID=UPI0025C471D0|nr:SDR family oxidoreductase [Bernardetia sp.]
MNLLSLSQKNVLVTGGYGYLGKAICEGLAEAGASVVVLAKSEEKFQTAFAESPFKANIHFHTFDISDTDSIRKGFEEVNKQFGKIDVLINNAFYSKGQSPEKMSDEDWNYGIDGNLNATYRCIREVIPYLKENGGKIINVSSMYGLISPDFSIYQDNNFLNPPHYGTAKAGVLQLTRYFACYLGKDNIQVNAITPGAFPSEEVQKHKEFIESLKNKSPLKKIGKPEDLKGAFVLLSSEASNFITGQNIVIDGGWTAW